MLLDSVSATPGRRVGVRPGGADSPSLPSARRLRASVAPRAASRGVVALTLCAVLSVGSRPDLVAAQTVRGAVMEAGSEEPLPGVLVSLLDFEGERVDATLTDEDGTFVFDVGRFGRFRLRAERIGLQTSTSAAFDLFGSQPHQERILMGQRAILIEGLVVDSRVEQCRLDRDNAVLLQRWWQEVRTALDVSSVVQAQGLVRFSVERFERAWNPRVSRILAETRNREMGLASRPFTSADASFLAEEGFVQGDVRSSRDYYAPDADVLLSDVFLAGHCFSLSDHDDEELLGLSFEPTDADVPDIMGTLWVDTTTAELQSLDFRYVNVDALPGDRAGGFVSFDYLPSGAWIVDEWYIRMPRLTREGDDDVRLSGYVDAGGRARRLEARAKSTAPDSGAIGSIRGVVWDSVGGRALAGATVSVVGTDLTAVTDQAGEFMIPRVPAGRRELTFEHVEPVAWGLGPPLVEVTVRRMRTSDVRLAIPSFRRVAGAICQGSGLGARAVLVGDVVRADGVGLDDATVVVSWTPEEDRRAPGDALPLPDRLELRVSRGGYFVACGVPPDLPLAVDVRVEGRLVRGYTVTVPLEGVVYRRMQLPLEG